MRWGLGCLLIVFPSGRLTWSPSGNYVGFLQLTFEKVEVFWEDTYQSLECELNKYKNAYICYDFSTLPLCDDGIHAMRLCV